MGDVSAIGDCCWGVKNSDASDTLNSILTGASVKGGAADISLVCSDSCGNCGGSSFMNVIVRFTAGEYHCSGECASSGAFHVVSLATDRCRVTVSSSAACSKGNKIRTPF